MRCDSCEADFLSFRHSVSDLDFPWLLYAGVLFVAQFACLFLWAPPSVGKAALVSLVWWVLGFGIYALRSRLGKARLRIAFLRQRPDRKKKKRR